MRILLIEDDIDLSEVICRRLTEAGYETEACTDGQAGFLLAKSGAHDLILLDRMLPGMDGVTLLRKLRREGFLLPVLLLTALDGIGDRVDGLDAGADDYLTKPFAVEELLARVRALCRRPQALQATDLLCFGTLQLDVERRVLSAKGQQAVLSKRESALLEAFLRNPEQPLARERLLLRVWGSSSEVEDGNLDAYIHFLRRRLKNLRCGLIIKTLHGLGYSLQKEDVPT